MSTNGTVTIKAGGQKVTVYNHSDSYPTWLGVRVANFILASDADTIPDQLARTVRVKESDKPTPDQLAEMKRLGHWENVSSGDDWYAALRNIQGDIAGYLAVGYIPDWSWGDNQEWGYLADFDARTLTITYDQKPHRVIPFANLTPESVPSIMTQAELAIMTQAELD